MAEYIKRETVINRIKEYTADVYGVDLDDVKQFGGGSRSENYCEGLYEATELIDGIPAADVAPVVHGRWIATHDEFCSCSLCKYPVHAAWSQTNYCPNCGAKMDGGTTDEL